MIGLVLAAGYRPPLNIPTEAADELRWRHEADVRRLTQTNTAVLDAADLSQLIAALEDRDFAWRAAARTRWIAGGVALAIGLDLNDGSEDVIRSVQSVQR